MSQIIETLHRLVTPQVLELVKNEAGSDDNKKDVLGALYAFLATRLTDSSAVSYANNLVGVDADNGLSLLTALNQDAPASQGFLTALKEAALTKLGVPAQTVDALATTGLPLAYRELKSLAGVQPLDSYLAPEREGFLSSLPAWATALLPVSLFGTLTSSAPINPLVEQDTVVTQKAEPVVTGTLHKEKKPEGSFMKGLLPIIGAIILAGLAWMLLKACQKEPTPVAAPTAPTAEQVAAANAAPATLSLALNETGDALYACNGEVGNVGLGEQIKAAIAGVFGADNCAFSTSNVANEMPAAQYLPQILGFMKGVPNATLSVADKTIRLNSSDAAALQKLVADVKGALPAEFTVEAEPVLNANEAIANSITAADTALSRLTASSTADELVRALNLQIINFATDSSEIPAENKAILDKAAELIKQIPDAHLKITGHTDNQGTLEYNQKLSESRAKAVHDYLVSKGVSDEKLEILGNSYNSPVASNATEQGRFRNRRIEFTVFKGAEEIASVGSAVAADTTAAAGAIQADAAALANNVQAATANAASTTANVAGNLVDSAKNATAAATNEVKNAASATTNEVKDVANAATTEIKDAANATKEAVSQ